MTSYTELLVKEEKYAYLISLTISLLVVGIVLFYTPSIEISEQTETESNIQIINLDKVSAPRRIVKKAISTEEGEPTTEETVDRARGTSLSDNAVDLAFYPNIAPPRNIGKLRKIYPKIAKEKNIEALLNTELLISADGKVLNVNVLAVRLSKSLPPEIYGVISAAFSRDAVKILLNARFTPAIVEGKRVPIKMVFPFRFKLEM
jgi:outer membrane biosynthesis protein TonB